MHTDHFDDENEIEVIYYPCDSCDKRFDNYEHLKTHLTSYHMPENPLKCSLEECRFSSKNINLMVLHIGVNHVDCVRR